jgi:YVTN family beta-propeller protein
MLVIDTQTLDVLDRLALVPDDYTVKGVAVHPSGIEVHPTGAQLFVLNRDSRDVSVIETGGHAIVETISVGINPSWGDFLVAADDVGGSIGGIRLVNLTCVNRGAGRRVELPADGADFSWNCDTAGFTSEPGDLIEF